MRRQYNLSWRTLNDTPLLLHYVILADLDKPITIEWSYLETPRVS